MQVQISREIDRPIADVWHSYAVEHVRNHPRWDPDMQLEQISEGPIRLGTRIRRVNTRWGTPVEGEMEVVTFEPEREFAVSIHDRNMDMVGRATFEAKSASQTLVTVTTELPDMPPDKAEFLRAMMERSLGDVKGMLESDTER